MHFSALTDYRQTGKVTHKLSDIILLTVCGVLSGQYTWEGIVDFGEMRRVRKVESSVRECAARWMKIT